MITNSRGKGIQSNQEGQNKNVPDGNIITNFTKAAASSSTTTTTTTSRQWSGFRNPRIVRVSRTFGGKDRHSKVSTVRGLRDRRIRLSVPTAIQLYDLQDRLGLSQPSKVIDWLIDVTSDDIDKLPPLQMLPHRGSLNTTSQFHLQQQQIMQFNPGLDVNNVPNFFDVNQRISDQLLGKGKTVKSDDDDQGDLARKLFPIGNNNMQQPSSIPGLLNNAMGSFNGYFHHNSESPGLSLSQYGGGGSHGFSLQPQMDHIMSNNNNNNGNGLSFSATSMPMSFGSSQLLPVPVVPSLFGPYASYITPAVDSNISTGGDDHRRHEIRHSNSSHMIQLLSSTSTSSQHFVQNNSLMPSLQYSIGPSTSLRSFPTFMANYPKHLHNSPNDNGSSSQQNKDDHAGS